MEQMIKIEKYRPRLRKWLTIGIYGEGCVVEHINVLRRQAERNGSKTKYRLAKKDLAMSSVRDNFKKGD